MSRTPGKPTRWGKKRFEVSTASNCLRCTVYAANEREALEIARARSPLFEANDTQAVKKER